MLANNIVIELDSQVGGCSGVLHSGWSAIDAGIPLRQVLVLLSMRLGVLGLSNSSLVDEP